MAAFECTPQNMATLAKLLATSATNPTYVLEQLQALREQPGFHYAVYSLLADPNSEPTARPYAASFLKNSAPNWWKRKGDADNKEAERKAIRDNLFEVTLREVNPNISRILAHLVGTVAASDFPKHWPNFFEAAFRILAGVHPQDGSFPTEVSQYTTAECCFDIISTFLEDISESQFGQSATRNKMVVEALPTIYKYWGLYSAVVMNLLKECNTSMLNHKPYVKQLELALAILQHITKSVTAIVILDKTGIVSLQDGAITSAIFQSFGECISQFQIASKQIPSHEQAINIRNSINHIRGSCTAAISNCLQFQPVLFRQYIQPYTNLFVNVLVERGNRLQEDAEMLAMQLATGECDNLCDEEDGTDLSLKGKDMAVIGAFNFLKMLCANYAFGAPDETQQTSSQVAMTKGLQALQARFGGAGQNQEMMIQETRQLAINLINDTWVKSLADLIITKFFIPRRYDLHQLMVSPDDYYEDFSKNTSRSSHNSEFVAAQECFRALLKRAPNTTLEVVTQYLKQAFGLMTKLVAGDTNTSANIKESWLVDASLQAIILVNSETNAVIHGLELADFSEPICATLNNFALVFAKQNYNVTTLYDVQQSKLLEGAFGKRFDDVSQYLTIFLRVLTVIRLADSICDVIKPELTVPILAALAQYFTVDNSYIQLQAFNLFSSLISVGSYRCVNTSAYEPYINFVTRSNTMSFALQCLTQHIFPQLGNETAQQECLASLKSIIEVDSHPISTLLSLLQTTLPVLSGWWKKFCGTSGILSASIFRIVATFVDRLGGLCYGLHSTVIFMLRSIIDTTQNQPQFQVLQAALELWYSYLSNVPYLTEDFMELFPHWVKIYTSIEAYDEVAHGILASYISLSFIHYPIGQQAVVDIQRIGEQFPVLQQQLQFQPLPPPSRRNFFDVHGLELFNAINYCFHATQWDNDMAVLVVKNIMHIAKFVPAETLLQIPTFVELMSNLLRFVIYAILTHASTSGVSIPYKVLKIEPGQVTGDIINTFITQFPKPKDPIQPDITDNIELLTYVLNFFASIMILSPIVFSKALANMQLPLPQQIPQFSNALNFIIYSFLALSYADDQHGVTVKPMLMALTTIYQTYRIFAQDPTMAQNPSIVFFTNSDLILSALTITLRFSDDESHTKPFEPAVFPPLDLSDKNQQTPKYFGDKREKMVENHDIANTPLTTASHNALGVLLSLHGPDQLKNIINSLDFGVRNFIDPALIKPQ